MGEIYLFLILFFGLVFLIILEFGKIEEIQYKNKLKKLKSDDVSEEEKEKIRNELKEEQRIIQKKENAIEKLCLVEYKEITDTYSKTIKGDLYLYETEIDFYQNYLDKLIFSIPINKIENVEYDKPDDRSSGILIGSSFIPFNLKDNTNYLIFEYKNDYGINNEVLFETAFLNKQKFVDELNALINNTPSYKQTNGNNYKINSSIETLKKLAQLKEEGIFTDEEFDKKKKELLNKIQ